MLPLLYCILIAKFFILLSLNSSFIFISAQTSAGWNRGNPAYQPAFKPQSKPVRETSWLDLIPPSLNVGGSENNWGGQNSNFWNWTMSNPWFWNFTIGYSGNWSDFDHMRPPQHGHTDDDAMMYLKNWTKNNPWFTNWTIINVGNKHHRNSPSRSPSDDNPTPHGDDDSADDRWNLWTPSASMSKSPSSTSATRPPHMQFESRRPVGVFTLAPFVARGSHRPNTYTGKYPTPSSAGSYSPESSRESHHRHFRVGVNQTIHNIANCSLHQYDHAFIHVLEITIDQLLNYNNSGDWTNATCIVKHILCNSLLASKSAVSTSTGHGLSSAHVIYTISYDITQPSVDASAPLIQLHSLVSEGQFSGTLQVNAADNNVPALRNAVGTTLSVSTVDVPTTTPVIYPSTSLSDTSSSRSMSTVAAIAIALGCGLGFTILVLILVILIRRVRLAKEASMNVPVTTEAQVVHDNTYKQSSNAAIIAYVTTDSSRLSLDQSSTASSGNKNTAMAKPSVTSNGDVSLTEAQPVYEENTV